jgi:Fe-S cluster assembly protein SufD
MKAMSATEHYIDQFTRVKNQLPGGDLAWLKQKREDALSRFALMGFPTIHQETWKYTNVKNLEKKLFQFTPEQKTVIDSEQLRPFLLGDDWPRIIFVDGFFKPELSKLTSLPAKITVASLAQVLKQDPLLVQNYLGYLSGEIQHSFAALNLALMADGAYIHMGKNSHVEQPIHLIFIATGSKETQAHTIRNLIIAEENSSACIIEHYIGLNNGSYFTNTISEIFSHNQTQLTHCKLQQESEQAFHIGSTHVKQSFDSHFDSFVFSFGGSLVRSDTNVELTEENTHSSLKGLFLTRNKQHMDFHTRIDHKQPRGMSREFYKGILTDQSRGVFNGKVIVHKDAQKTDADQHSKNLLLSRMAEIDTKPELEIYADDVKCCHGATVGQLDEDALFYLRARGIDQTMAESILVYAFASEIIGFMNVPLLQTYLQQLLTSLLDKQ